MLSSTVQATTSHVPLLPKSKTTLLLVNHSTLSVKHIVDEQKQTQRRISGAEVVILPKNIESVEAEEDIAEQILKASKEKLTDTDTAIIIDEYSE